MYELNRDGKPIFDDKFLKWEQETLSAGPPEVSGRASEGYPARTRSAPDPWVSEGRGYEAGTRFYPLFEPSSHQASVTRFGFESVYTTYEGNIIFKSPPGALVPSKGDIERQSRTAHLLFSIKK